jgi:hypothetical protein
MAATHYNKIETFWKMHGRNTRDQFAPRQARRGQLYRKPAAILPSQFALTRTQK